MYGGGFSWNLENIRYYFGVIVSLPAFKGLTQLPAPQRLDPGQAVDAVNCRIESGDLVPYLAPAEELAAVGGTATGTHTIFKYASGRWVRWDVAANVVRSPVINDAKARLYWTEPPTSYPKVTDSDIIGATNGAAVSASRRVGVPAPVAGNYGLVQPTIPGLATVSSIVFTVQPTEASSSAEVTTTAAHGLSSGDTVTFDYPGIALASAYAVKYVDADSFTARGLKLRQFTIVTFRRDKPGTSAVYSETNLQVRAPGHKLQSGDKVVIACSNSTAWISNSAGTKLSDFPNTIYEVEVINANRFYLNGTARTWNAAWADEVGGSVATADAALSGSTPYCVVVSSAENPYQKDGADPTVLWYNPYYTVTTNGILDTGTGEAQNTVTDTTVAAKLRTTYYLITYVNGYGQEGPPSAPFGVTSTGAAVTYIPGETTTTITWTSVSLTGVRGTTAAVNNADLTSASLWYTTALRIYRLDSLGQWRLVNTSANVAFSAGTYADNVAEAALGEVLSTTGYIDPPDGLQGLVSTLNGVLAGYESKTVMACVPYQPHAWPVAYRVTAQSAVKGLVPTSAGLIVITDGYPELLVGTDPATWQLVKLEIPQACTSARSIVDMGEWGMYASPDGLVAIQQNDAQVATAKLFNRAQWATYGDATASLIGAFYEGRYFGSYVSGGSRKAFLFDPATLDFVRLDMGASYVPVALYMDLTTDTLYFLGADGVIYKFDRGASYLGMSWTSGTFQSSLPWNPAAGQVIASLGTGATLTCALYGDATLRHTQTVTSEAPFRLPGNYRARDYKLVLTSTGDARVQTVAVAGAVDELKGV